MRYPTNADAETIGEVVTIQVFERTSVNSDSLKNDSLKKFVGKLQAFVFDGDDFIFGLEGGVSRTVYLGKYHVEIIPLKHMKQANSSVGYVK